MISIIISLHWFSRGRVLSQGLVRVRLGPARRLFFRPDLRLMSDRTSRPFGAHDEQTSGARRDWLCSASHRLRPEVAAPGTADRGGASAKGSTPSQSNRAGAPAKASNEPAASSGEEDQAQILALVLLRTSPAELEPSRVQELVRQEFGNAVASTMDKVEQEGFITGYMFDADPFVLVVHDCVRTYVPPQSMMNTAASIPHAEARAGFLKHRAWVSVDLMPMDLAKAKLVMTADEALDRLGRIAAELRDDKCVALYSTGHVHYIPASAATPERLRAGDILDLFPRVAHVPKEDQDMNAAIEEARQRWPQFVTAWNNRQGSCMFLVKARFEEPDGVEHMWIRVDRIEGDKITGELGNQPGIYRKAKQGDSVTVEQSQLSDWAYITKSESDGGFTDPSVPAMAKGRRE